MFSMIQGRKLALAAAVFALMSVSSLVTAAAPKKVERLPLPDGNDFPISSAVTVRTGVDTSMPTLG